MRITHGVPIVRVIQAAAFLFSGLALGLTAACSKQTQAAPAIALSTTDEGIPPGPRLSPRTTGDTIVCETPQRFRTAEGDRWLWVRIITERKPGEQTENTVAETVVSTDAEGNQTDQNVELAGIRLDGGREYTLRKTSGVRTAEKKESPPRRHSARGYTRAPDMGPVDAICGGP
jgi:hypothetical protein